jgi:hypothetical protein
MVQDFLPVLFYTSIFGLDIIFRTYARKESSTRHLRDLDHNELSHKEFRVELKNRCVKNTPTVTPSFGK